jgi:hypothetical protein
MQLVFSARLFCSFLSFFHISLEMQVGACLDEIHLRVLVDQDIIALALKVTRQTAIHPTTFPQKERK